MAVSLGAAAQSPPVRGPKQILWYQTDHGLNQQASLDRQKWLHEALKLK
jgi:hypothetical protein